MLNLLFSLYLMGVSTTLHEHQSWELHTSLAGLHVYQGEWH